jgi:hypothetical protein
MAKAFTGGLEKVMTATPSFPTSMVTLLCAIASRIRDLGFQFLYQWIKKLNDCDL